MLLDGTDHRYKYEANIQVHGLRGSVKAFEAELSKLLNKYNDNNSDEEFELITFEEENW